LELKKKLAAREHELAEALAREEATAELLRTIANPTIDAELAPRLISLLRRANNHWRRRLFELRRQGRRLIVSNVTQFPPSEIAS
jgi:hypothetical protein